MCVYIFSAEFSEDVRQGRQSTRLDLDEEAQNVNVRQHKGFGACGNGFGLVSACQYDDVAAEAWSKVKNWDVCKQRWGLLVVVLGEKREVSQERWFS